MLKRKLGLVLAVAGILFAVGCKQPTASDETGGGETGGGATLTADKTITTDMSDTSLGGYTVTVNAGNVVLKNISNGRIVIGSGVGNGTVKIDGGSDLDVTVKSGANVVLSSTTKLNSLKVTNEAIKATITSEARANAARSARDAGGVGDASIDLLEVQSEADVVLDVKKDVTIKEAVSHVDDNDNAGDIISPKGADVDVQELYFDKGGVKEGLTLEVDDTYDGDGVRIKIGGRREKDVPQMMMVFDSRGDDGFKTLFSAQDADWSSEKQRELIHADTFTYEYLNTDQEYNLQFVYIKPLPDESEIKDGLIVKDSVGCILLGVKNITVTPTKGSEPEIDFSKVNATVDSATGDITWSGVPSIDSKYFTKGTRIGYNVLNHIKGERISIGGGDFAIETEAAVEAHFTKPINIYKDFGYSGDVASLESDDGMIALDVNFTFVGPDGKDVGIGQVINRIENINFDKTLFPEISIDTSKNILKFTKAPDAKVIPSDAEGYYYNIICGGTGVWEYEQFSKTKFDDIDLNYAIESTKDVKDAIKEKGSYSIELKWYKTVDNKPYDIGYLYSKDDIKYTEVSDFNAPDIIRVDSEKNILYMTKAGEKFIEKAKALGDTGFQFTLGTRNWNAEGFWNQSDCLKYMSWTPYWFKDGGLPEEIDLNMLMLVKNDLVNTIENGKIWIGLGLRDDKDTESNQRTIFDCTEFSVNAELLKTLYEQLPTVTLDEELSGEGYSTITVTRPGEKLVEAYTAKGADRIVCEIWARDEGQPEDDDWCGWATFVFDEDKIGSGGTYLDPEKPVTVILNTDENLDFNTQKLVDNGNSFVITTRIKNATDENLGDILGIASYTQKLKLKSNDLSGWNPEE